MLPSDLDNARRIVELIRDLTQEEGDEVRIHNFGGSRCAIGIIRRFKFGERKRFWVGSVLECLEKAKRERDRGR